MLKQNPEDCFGFDPRKEHLLDDENEEEILETVTQSNGQVEFAPLYNLHSANINRSYDNMHNAEQDRQDGQLDVNEDLDLSEELKGDVDWVTQNLGNIDNEELTKVLEQVAANGTVDYVDDLLNLDVDEDDQHLHQNQDQEQHEFIPDSRPTLTLSDDQLLNATQAAYPPEARERLRAVSDEMLAALYANEELLGADPLVPQDQPLTQPRRLSEGDVLMDRPLYVPTDSNRSLLSAGRESFASQDGRKAREERAQSNNSLYYPGGLPTDNGATEAELNQRQAGSALKAEDGRRPEVEVRFTTKFQPKYWRNDRKNLQCFPFCVEHDDYYTVRLYKLEHQRKGTCGTSVRAKVAGLDNPINARMDFATTYLAIGRIALLGPEGTAGFLQPGEEVSGEELAEMVSSSVKGSIKVNVQPEEESAPNGKQAVELEFVQALWKVNMVLSKKRRPVNIPSKIPRYAFEVILFRKSDGSDTYTVVTQHMSAPFQIASTRTLNRELKALEKSPSPPQQLNMPAPKRKVDLKYEQDNIHQESVKRFKSRMLVAQRGNDTVKHVVKHEPPKPVSEATTLETSAAEGAARSESQRVPPPSAPKPGPGVERRDGEGGQVVKPEGSDLPKEAPSAPPPAEPRTTSTPMPQVQAGEGPGVRLESTQEGRMQVGSGVDRREPQPDWAGEYTELEFTLSTMYLICIFGGLFGVHRFLMNDHFWGKYYAFTLGGLGIGYIIDLIRLPKLYKASNDKLRKLARDPYYREPELLSVTDTYIVLFSTGLFGGHHFLLGNKGLGYAYLFTCGFCAIGWLHDFFTINSMVFKYNARQRDLFNLQYGARNDAGIELRNV